MREIDVWERRRYRRYRLRNRGVVMVTPHLIFSYSVEDISRGGLAFIYSGWCDWQADPIRMTFLDRDFFLDKVPLRVVADREFTEIVDDEVPRLRRCSVQFEDLTAEQVRELESYFRRLEGLE